jgi:tRNA threonylcarbamoyl adenosine modification protein (Sua5/YciO/YrdC/YwlC family)
VQLPEVLDASDPGTVDLVVGALVDGGLVVLPTDTVYGLVALPQDAAAMARLFDAKGRRADTPIAVLCSDARQAGGLVDPLCEPGLRDVGERWWPGPLTLVFPRRPGIDLHLGEPEGTVGVRVPDHPLVRSVAERLGPIAATSANHHGEPPVASAEEALAVFAGAVSLIVDDGPIEGRASTVVDATARPWRILREGPLPADDIVSAGQAHLL